MLAIYADVALDPLHARARRWKAHCAVAITGVQAPGQDALLGMQAVLRLVEHHRLRPVDHLVGDLLAAMRRQAMHEHRVRLGLRHQARH